MATVGLVIGALLARRIDGLAERLGRRRRSLALPVCVPVGFAVVTAAALAVPRVPSAVALGIGLGALGTGVTIRVRNRHTSRARSRPAVDQRPRG